MAKPEKLFHPQSSDPNISLNHSNEVKEAPAPDLNEWNFLPLSKPAGKNTIRSLKDNSFFTVSVAVASVMMAIMFFGFLLGLVSVAFFVSALALLPGLAVGIVLYFAEPDLSGKQLVLFAASNQRFKNFAKANQLNYRPKDSTVSKNGSLFLRTNSEVLINCIDGRLPKGWPFTLYHYQLTLGNNSKRQTRSTVIEVELDHNFPHIFLNSKLTANSNVDFPVHFNSRQRIQLSSKFDKYFDIYTPEGYQVTALSILTPDVMEMLMYFKKFSNIEIIGNRLFFYWPEHLIKESDVKAIFSQANDLMNKIGPKLQRGNVYASQEQAETHQVLDQSSTIKLKRNKLHYLTDPIMFISLVAVYYVFDLLVITLIFILLIAFSYFRRYRNYRLRRQHQRLSPSKDS